MQKHKTKHFKKNKANLWITNKNRIVYFSIAFLLLGLLFLLLKPSESYFSEGEGVISPQPMQSVFPCPRDNMVILSVDGGGSRGVIPLAFLTELESQSGKNTSQLFDLMAGISTGTIITSALAVGPDRISSKYSAKTLLSLYEHDAKIIFNNSFWHQLKTLWGLAGPRLSNEGKNKILHSYLGALTLNELNNKVVIFSYDLLNAKVRMFCNWSVCNILSNSFPVSNLVSGATSIPAVFSPVILYKNTHEKAQVLSDLSLMINNPAYLSYLLSKKSCPKVKHYLIVSLGTGHYPLMNNEELNENSGALVWLPNILASSLEMSSEIIDNYMVSLMELEERKLKDSKLPELIYLRFNPVITWSKKNPMDSSQEALTQLAAKGSFAFQNNKELIHCIASIKQQDSISEHCSLLFLKFIRDQKRILLEQDNLPMVISE